MDFEDLFYRSRINQITLVNFKTQRFTRISVEIQESIKTQRGWVRRSKLVQRPSDKLLTHHYSKSHVK